MEDPAVLAELRALREEVVRTRLMMARTMSLLLSFAQPMSFEAAERISRHLMGLDDPA